MYCCFLSSAMTIPIFLALKHDPLTPSSIGNLTSLQSMWVFYRLFHVNATMQRSDCLLKRGSKLWVCTSHMFLLMSNFAQYLNIKSMWLFLYTCHPSLFPNARVSWEEIYAVTTSYQKCHNILSTCINQICNIGYNNIIIEWPPHNM